MARVDVLLARLLARERRTQELITTMLAVSEDEDSSDDEVEVEEMWIVQDMLTRVCALEARLCAVEAKVDEAELAEQQQQSAVGACALAIHIERVPRIEIDVATAAAVAAAAVFARAVMAELSAIAVVWWDGCDEKVVMMKDVVRFKDWMREWEAMVRWCGGGRWRRLLLIE
jgi:hypothetical protein